MNGGSGTVSVGNTTPLHRLSAARIVWVLGRGLIALERRGSTWRAVRESPLLRPLSP